jgi:Kef-type K+ transport system membrane component KefB
MNGNSSPGATVRQNLRYWITYVVMFVCAVAAFFVIRHFGEMSTAALTDGSPSPAATAARHGNTLFHVLLALIAVIVLGQFLGAIFRLIGQPPVIGEVVAGILLGPSLLGRIAPDAANYLLPPSIAPSIGVIAQLGVILYMFVLGLELDTDFLRKHGRASIMISHTSILLPFVLGAWLALALYPRFADRAVPFTVFALFLGAAMSITAFPVLARILTDRRMDKSELGVVALTCAAAGDVTAWCLLALLVAVAKAQAQGAVWVLVWTIVYLAFMVVLLRPCISRWARQFGDHEITSPVLAVVFIGLLVSSLTTELIGIHALFGAFLFGGIFPHDGVIARTLSDKLRDPVTILLLPAFFAFAGIRTQIGLVSGWENWLWCGAIIVVATIGKFGGTLIAARWNGFDWRDASCLGVLMNTRGLMELIVLNVGLDLQIISPTIFAMMVIMALFTTVITTPVLRVLCGSCDRD